MTDCITYIGNFDFTDSYAFARNNFTLDKDVSEEEMKKWIDRGALPSDKAFSQAVKYRRIDLMKMLIKDYNEDPSNTFNIFDCAIEYNDIDFLKFILEKYPNIETKYAVQQAAQSGKNDILELILNKYNFAWKLDKETYLNSISRALSNDFIDSFELLLKYNPHHLDPNEYGIYALMPAVNHKRLNEVRFILDNIPFTRTANVAFSLWFNSKNIDLFRLLVKDSRIVFKLDVRDLRSKCNFCESTEIIHHIFKDPDRFCKDPNSFDINTIWVRDHVKPLLKYHRKWIIFDENKKIVKITSSFQYKDSIDKYLYYDG